MSPDNKRKIHAAQARRKADVEESWMSEKKASQSRLRADTPSLQKNIWKETRGVRHFRPCNSKARNQQESWNAERVRQSSS
jgi:hypothetical protein